MGGGARQAQVTVRAQAVVFDLDDTLLDHRGAARDALRTWLAARSTAEDFDVLERRWHELETRYYELFQSRAMTLQEQRRARVRAFLPNESLTEDHAADRAFDDYWSAYRLNWRAFPDALQAIDRARQAGVRVGILTNGDVSLQSAKLEVAGLIGDDIVFAASSELPAAKPGLEAYHAMQHLLGVDDPRDCVMVGDSWVNDVQGAVQAGWRAVFLDRFSHLDNSPLGRDRRPVDVPVVTSLDVLVIERG